MKIPKNGEFIQEEGSIYAENDETGDEIIFFADQSKNLCFRSMMEDDVHKVMDAYGANSRKRKALRRVFTQKDSQLFNFVIEEMNIFTEDGQRKIVGDCQINEDGKTFIQLYVKTYKKDANYAVFLRDRTLAVVSKILDEFGLDITPEISRVSKKY